MARNCRRHGENSLPLRLAVQWATHTAYDLWQMFHPVKSTGVVPRSPQAWEKPAPGWIKGNVDAAFFDRERSAASGVALRQVLRGQGHMVWSLPQCSSCWSLGLPRRLAARTGNGAWCVCNWKRTAKSLSSCGRIDQVKNQRLLHYCGRWRRWARALNFSLYVSLVEIVIS